MILPKSLILLASLGLASCNQNMKDPPAPEVLAPGVAKTYSGLKHKILRAGKGGPTPNSLSIVTAHYKGTTIDGKVFDNSYERGKPTEFALDQVIEGWTEGLQLMTRGEKRRFWIPARLAYGDNPRPRKPGGELIFDVELISFHQ